MGTPAVNVEPCAVVHGCSQIRLAPIWREATKATCRNAARAARPLLKFVCPSVEPLGSMYSTISGRPGQLQVFPGKTVIVGEPRNLGDNPCALHWFAGVGTWLGFQEHMVSDIHNVARGRPTIVSQTSTRGGTRLVYRFPPAPAGGIASGHYLAAFRRGPRVWFVSIHGEDSARLRTVETMLASMPIPPA